MNILCPDGDAFGGNFSVGVDFHYYAACDWLFIIQRQMACEQKQPFVSAGVRGGGACDEPKGGKKTVVGD